MGITVKIWYGSGAFENVPNIETDELATTIYAEAEGNPSVVAGELHRADGSVAASFDHRQPVKCGQLLDNSKALWETITRDVVCVRETGHRGLHRDTWAIHDDTYKWDDDVCLPLAQQP